MATVSMETSVAFLVTVILGLTTVQGNFHFSPNIVYTYRYEGTVDMQSTIGLRVDAEVTWSGNYICVKKK